MENPINTIAYQDKFTIQIIESTSKTIEIIVIKHKICDKFIKIEVRPENRLNNHQIKGEPTPTTSQYRNKIRKSKRKQQSASLSTTDKP